MESKAKTQSQLQEKEAQAAQVDIWKYVFAFAPIAVLKCAIELQISETVESHGGFITLPELSVALHCSPSALHRIMRFLIYHGFLQANSCYSRPRIICLLHPNATFSIAFERWHGCFHPAALLESSPVMLAPWHGLSGRAMLKGASPFEAAHGGLDFWKYAAENPDYSKLINDAMACHARLAFSAIVDRYPEAFEGISSLVDVGGGDGTALNALVKACPWIRGVNYDLPDVISVAPPRQGVEHVGDMFKRVPKGDAAFLMWVLHDWSDEECIQILRNCMEAIPRDKGKVIIVEAVVEVEEGVDEYSEVRLALDMGMMAHTETGKERTWEEWGCLLNEAGFIKYTEKRIEDVLSVIEAYP